MLDQRSSTPKLASPHRLSAGKYVALASLVGVGLVGLWYSAKSDFDLSLDEGRLNEPHKVLIFAHGDRGIANWVSSQILTTGPYAFRIDPSPVKFEAKRFPPVMKRSSLNEKLTRADEQGYGYIAIDLKGPGSDQWKQDLLAAYPELEFSERDRWAVIRSDRRSDNLRVHIGQVQSGVHAPGQASARSALMQALFKAPDIFKLAHPEAPPTMQTLPIARNGVTLSRIGWRDFPFPVLSQRTIEAWPPQIDTAATDPDTPLWIAAPMQQVLAEPLSASSILLKSAPLRWTNASGSSLALSSRASSQGWTLDIAIRSHDGGLQTLACEGISGVRALAVKTSLDGQVIEFRRDDNGQQVFSISIDAHGNCHTELLSQTLASSEPLTLGLPDLSGKSSWLAAGQDQKTLIWRYQSSSGKVTLPEGQFIRDRWQWQKDGSLLALTKRNDPEGAPFVLERIRQDDKAPEGLLREVQSEFATLQDAQDLLVRAQAWPEIGHTQERRFGANLRQAVFLPKP